MSKKLPKTIIEVATIVASILLAFSIDAAWEIRKTNQKQQVALESLGRDFAANRIAADNVIQMHERRADFYVRFMESTPEEVASISSDSVLSQHLMFAPTTFDAVLGSVDALIGAGDLGLIQNRDLQQGLVNFKRASQDLAEEGERMWENADEVLNRFALLGGPWQAMDNNAPVLTPPDLARIRADEQAMASIRVSYHWSTIYLEDLRLVSDAIDQIRELIRSESQ